MNLQILAVAAFAATVTVATQGLFARRDEAPFMAGFLAGGRAIPLCAALRGIRLPTFPAKSLHTLMLPPLLSII